MLFKVLMNGPVIGQRMVGRILRETVANKDLIQETVALKIVLTKLIKIKLGNLEFVHVKGHAGDPGNEAADRLANQGADQYGKK